MAKNIRSWRVFLFCTLSVLATIAFIVACGNGQVIDLVSIEKEIDSSTGQLKGRVEDNTIYEGYVVSSSEQNEPSSSSEIDDPPSQGTSSSAPTDNPKPSSSSAQTQSGQSSSSGSKPSSSSGVSLYELTCTLKTPISVVGIGKISDGDKPVVKCKTIATNREVTLEGGWDYKFVVTPELDWDGASAGSYQVKINVYNESEVCNGMEKSCGTLVITKSSASTGGGTSSASNGGGGNSSNSSGGNSSNSNGGGASSASTGGGTEYCKWDTCTKLEDPNAIETSGLTKRENCVEYSEGVFNNSNCTGTPVAGGFNNEWCKWPDSDCDNKCCKLTNPNGPNKGNSSLTNKQNCEQNSPSKTVYKNNTCTTTGGSTSSSSRASSSSAANNQQSSNSNGGGGNGNTITITNNSTKVEIASTITKYKCVFLAYNGTKFLCRARASDCTNASSPFSITVGNGNTKELECYSAGFPKIIEFGDNLCDAVGTTNLTERNISIPSGKTVECSIGY
ncbi:hypothetical protein R83H12_00135 [Fibrobacteria bacterium R8-3-H12]